MQRAVRVAQLWPWLPAFRTVAETQHLPTAADILELSVSALSRSVKQLEDCLGEPLFTREGGRMRLNRSGERLLVAVRDAMRRIDDGVDDVASTAMQSLRIASDLAWLELLVLPSMALPISIDVVDLEEAARPTALLRGEIDLALCEQVQSNEQLAIEHIGEIVRAVCWHRDLSETEAAALPLAVCAGQPEAGLASRHERVALRTTSLAVIVEACRTGRMRAVLPIAIAHARDLRTSSQVTTSPLFLLQRRALVESPAGPFIAELKQQTSRVLGPPT